MQNTKSIHSYFSSNAPLSLTSDLQCYLIRRSYHVTLSSVFVHLFMVHRLHLMIILRVHLLFNILIDLVNNLAGFLNLPCLIHSSYFSITVIIMAMFLKVPNDVARRIEAFAQSPCDVEFIRKYGTGIRAHMIHQSGAPADSDMGAMRYIWEVDDLASLKVGMLILVDFVPPRSEWRVKYISSRTANRICFVGDRHLKWSLDSIVIRLFVEVEDRPSIRIRHFGRFEGYPVIQRSRLSFEQELVMEKEDEDRSIRAIVMNSGLMAM